MYDDEQRSLKRLNIENKLPIGFNELTKEEQLNVLKKIQAQDIEIRGELLRKVGDSKIAEHDLAVGIDAVQKLDDEGKIYSETIKTKTGSGTTEVTIRGGDTKFIVPILVIIGVIILGIILMFSIK